MIDRQVHRTAKQFIEIHGEAALMEAMKLHNYFSARGKKESADIWDRVYVTIEWMQTPDEQGKKGFLDFKRSFFLKNLKERLNADFTMEQVSG